MHIVLVFGYLIVKQMQHIMVLVDMLAVALWMYLTDNLEKLMHDCVTVFT